MLPSVAWPGMFRRDAVRLGIAALCRIEKIGQ
jgi:hypothetical protein